MIDKNQRPIIVKRIKKGGHGHHGGSWKIAYADFVTAMMAFFLVMWMLGSMGKYELEGIAEYFRKPIREENSGGKQVGDRSQLLPGGGDDFANHIGQVSRGAIESISHDADDEKSVDSSGTKEKSPNKNRIKDKSGDKDKSLKNGQDEGAGQAQGKGEHKNESNEESEEQQAAPAQLVNLKKQIETKIRSDASFNKFNDQIKVEAVPEGLKIELNDLEKHPMFDGSTTELSPDVKNVLRWVGKTINSLPNKIMIYGYTDATPYNGNKRDYSNWELSADRANTCRRELVKGGMNETKVSRVAGFGATAPTDRKHIFDPVNRRISIILLNLPQNKDHPTK